MAAKTKRGILGYTTEVAPTKTIAEITTLLVAKKASSVRTDYEEGKAVAIEFVIPIGGNLVPFRLRPNIRGAAGKLPRYDLAQAERTAWRILLRWVEAQVAMVEMSQAEMGQVFLPYAVSPQGETFWSAFQQSQTKQLGGGA